jgi:hypothetical protein
LMWLKLSIPYGSQASSTNSQTWISPRSRSKLYFHT